MSCECSLYSFDIFDTLITRKVARPTGIFVLMQDIINSDTKFKDLPSDVKENFFNYRIDAEFRQRRINKLWKDGKDITFNQIYEDFQTTHLLSDEQCNDLKNLEIKTELENIIPIHENINRLKLLLDNGKRVVLISDMYLPEEIIKQLLTKCDSILPDIKLYLSSTLGYMKTTKELYKYVQEQEQVEFSDWVHIGDNKFADYSNALDLGINAELYHYIKLTSYEQKTLDKNFSNPIVQLFIGCAKNTNLINYNQCDKYKLGVSLAGTIFYPYISWLLDQCQKRGLKRLYFIARDGFILKHATDILIKERNLDIKTYYLYGSRKAWRLPALSMSNNDLYEQFIESGMWEYTKLEQVFGLKKSELLKLLPLKFHKYSKKFRLRKQRKLKEFLLEDRTILSKIIENNKEKRNNAIGYLKENIDYSDDNFALVDLDGSGFTQNCLSELMSDFYHKTLKCFYFSSTPATFIPINVQRICFYSLKGAGMGNFLELLTKAPHGQTIGYRQNETGNWIPELEKINLQYLKDWDFDEYLNGVTEFIIQIEKYKVKYSQYSFETQILLKHYINFICKTIDKDTANLLGSTLHSSFGRENEEFAPKINFFEAMKYICTNRLKTGSLLYSKVRSHKLIREMIEYKQSHPDIRKELINIFIHKRRKQAYMKLLGIKISFRHLLWKDVI